MNRQWRSLGTAPGDFTPTQVIANEDGTGVLVGYTGARAFDDPDARVATVFRVGSEGLQPATTPFQGRAAHRIGQALSVLQLLVNPSDH